MGEELDVFDRGESEGLFDRADRFEVRVSHGFAVLPGNCLRCAAIIGWLFARPSDNRLISMQVGMSWDDRSGHYMGAMMNADRAFSLLLRKAKDISRSRVCTSQSEGGMGSIAPNKLPDVSRVTSSSFSTRSNVKSL